MTKSDIIRAIAVQQERSPQDVKDIIDSFFDILTGTLVAGEDVKLELFGKFELRHHKPVMRRNPRTGAPVSVPAKTSVGFKPSLHLKAVINGEA